MSIHRREKSNSIKDLLVKIARREHLEISEGDITPFSIYASAWLERKKAILARSTYGDYRSIWKKYVLPYFGNMPLCRVTRRDVEAFLGNLPDISAKRKNNIMVPLKCLFNDASRRGEIDETPSENIRRLKEIKPFIDPFSFGRREPGDEGEIDGNIHVVDDTGFSLYHLSVTGKELVKQLKTLGWVSTRIDGSHHILVRGTSTISVPVHGKKDLKKGTSEALLRQGGLK